MDIADPNEKLVNHKGAWCPIANITCQEGYCSSCEIFLQQRPFKSCECKSYGPKPQFSDDQIASALLEIAKYQGPDSQVRLTIMGQVLDHLEEFKRGFNEELEHGCRSPETNITCDDPVATARIVLAHLVEESDYYTKHNLGEPILSEGQKAQIMTFEEAKEIFGKH